MNRGYITVKASAIAKVENTNCAMLGLPMKATMDSENGNDRKHAFPKNINFEINLFPIGI